MPVYKDKPKTKDGRQWYFIYNYKVDGKYKKYWSKSYSTKTEAQEAEANFRINENIAEYSNNKTIKELLQEYYNYKKDKVKPTTLNSNRKSFKYIADVLGSKKLRNLTFKDVERFKRSMPDKWSIAYKNDYIKHLKALNNYCFRAYSFRNVEIDKLERFKDLEVRQINFFTLDEFNLFIDKVKELNYKALFTTLFYCGLRLGEALALNWNDISDNISITKSLTSKIKGEPYTITSPKNKTSVRKIPIPIPVRKILQEWYNEISKTYGFEKSWFVFKDFSPLKESSITNIKNKACKEAEVKQIRIHDFRHSCASLLINNGAKINLVAEYLGHADIKMTLNTYSHLYDSELNKIVERINNL